MIAKYLFSLSLRFACEVLVKKNEKERLQFVIIYLFVSFMACEGCACHIKRSRTLLPKLLRIEEGKETKRSHVYHSAYEISENNGNEINRGCLKIQLKRRQ